MDVIPEAHRFALALRRKRKEIQEYVVIAIILYMTSLIYFIYIKYICNI